MALWGDFRTYPLPDLLQWLDEGRHSGVLFLEGAVRRRLRFYKGTLTGYGGDKLVVATAQLAVAYGLVADSAASSAAKMAGDNLDKWISLACLDRDALRSLMTEETSEIIFDSIADPDGSFEYQAEEALEDEGWIPIQVEVRSLLLEGMRHLDERPEVDRLFGAEGAKPRVISGRDRSALPQTDRRLLELVDQGLTLGEIRWTLRSSSQAVRRRLFDLARAGFVEPPSGEAVGPDPIGRLIEQGLVLLRERQFEEVTHVFESLLSMDHADPRVREFLRHIEQEHAGELYRLLFPIGVPEVVVPATEIAKMAVRPEERTVLEFVDGRRDVARIVAMSPLRELNTLKALCKLEQSGAVYVRRR